MATTTYNEQQHMAAFIDGKRKPIRIAPRTTPLPAPREVLITSKALAVNPIDYMNNASGFFLKGYPSIIGSDVAGVVAAVGSEVTGLKIGDRVTALAPCFEKKGAPDYGAFQEKVLVPGSNVALLPSSVSFTDAAMLPLAVRTAWVSFSNLGIDADPAHTPADKKGILVWSAASGMGSTTIQIARSMGFYVYATASRKHHAYLSGLGSGSGKLALFDYADKDVAAQIVRAAQADGVAVDKAILAAGNHRPCIEVLDRLKGGPNVLGKISSMPWGLYCLWWNIFPKWWGTSLTFCSPTGTEAEKAAKMSFYFKEWLTQKLANGSIVCSPHPQLLKGLGSIEQGLADWKKGVSCAKVVIEL